MMADNQLFNDNDGGDDDVFVYTGGEQEVPRDIKRVRIAENVDTIAESTFRNCQQLIEVVGHNKIRKIEEYAFYKCIRLRSVAKMTSVIEIEENAFNKCCALSELELDKLEIIGYGAFSYCESIRTINVPSIRSVDRMAFQRCLALTDAVFGQNLESIERNAFFNCTALRRIVIPLKDNLIIDNLAFNNCENFSRVDTLDEGIRKTITSLHLESWRNEMLEEMNIINQTLPNTSALQKAGAIQQWSTRVLGRIEHYKGEHQTLLKEAMTLLELALWKAKVDEVTKKAKIDAETARKDHRVTCGASIVIKNVLPFLALK